LLAGALAEGALLADGLTTEVRDDVFIATILFCGVKTGFL
jgi:hypothetical protein